MFQIFAIDLQLYISISGHLSVLVFDFCLLCLIYFLCVILLLVALCGTQSDSIYTGFVQTLESPGIKTLRFPGWEGPGIRPSGLEKPWKSTGILK